MNFVVTTGRMNLLPALHSVKSTKVAHLLAPSGALIAIPTYY